MLIDVLTQQLLLVIYYTLQTVGFLFHGLYASHRTVVYAAHTYSKHGIGTFPHFQKPLPPVIEHLFPVRNIVVFAADTRIPFFQVVAH